MGCLESVMRQARRDPRRDARNHAANGKINSFSPKIDKKTNRKLKEAIWGAKWWPRRAITAGGGRILNPFFMGRGVYSPKKGCRNDEKIETHFLAKIKKKTAFPQPSRMSSLEWPRVFRQKWPCSFFLDFLHDKTSPLKLLSPFLRGEQLYFYHNYNFQQFNHQSILKCCFSPFLSPLYGYDDDDDRDIHGMIGGYSAFWIFLQSPIYIICEIPKLEISKFSTQNDARAYTRNKSDALMTFFEGV